MQNLFRRPSGIYFLRLAVPVQLRQVFGRREIVATTGTRELTVAKLVAGAQAAQWRRRFFNSRRLMSLVNPSTMDHQEILTLARGHPILLAGGHLPLAHASTASGISTTDLLRAAASDKLSLFVRTGTVRGHLLQPQDLVMDDPEMGPAGGYEVPFKEQMPASAAPYICKDLLMISAMDLPGITAALLTSADPFDLFAFEAPEKPGLVFVPDAPIGASLDRIEVASHQVEALRKSVASLIEPECLAEAKELQKSNLRAATATDGKKANERLSTALDAYITNRVRQDVALEGEITRIKNGCTLLIELEGDLPLTEIDTDKLRRFRNQKLSRVPANENKIRLIHGSKSITESIEVADRMHLPVMSASERDKRIRWIRAWFRWLHDQKWIAEDPASSLRGEAVLTKLERARSRRHVAMTRRERPSLRMT